MAFAAGRVHGVAVVRQADTTKPVARPPTQQFRRWAQVDTSTSPELLTLDLSWSAGTDNATPSSGLLYKLQYRRSSDNGATWTTYRDIMSWSGSQTFGVRVQRGTLYQFQVLAKDAAGNISSPATGSTFRALQTQEGSTAINYIGTWGAYKWSEAYGCWSKSSSTLGSTATYSFTGSSIAWVSDTGTMNGWAQVYIDGVKLPNPINVYYATDTAREVVFQKSWPTSGSHEIKVEVLHTKDADSTTYWVDVDAFVRLTR